MESPDGQLTGVFNGEIYNYLELKRELQQLGHDIRSSSDTEVLLHAYDQLGTDCVARLLEPCAMDSGAETASSASRAALDWLPAP